MLARYRRHVLKLHQDTKHSAPILAATIYFVRYSPFSSNIREKASNGEEIS
jgi:hypothetical protein